MKYASELLTFHATALLLTGVALLFAPAEVGVSISEAGIGQALFVQLLGAAFIGFAAANWIMRHSPIGGIYGRAIVIGNQAFALVGTLVLLGSFPNEPGIAFWVLLAVFGSGAVLHGVLLLRGPRSGSQEEPP